MQNGAACITFTLLLVSKVEPWLDLGQQAAVERRAVPPGLQGT
ncbi:hypothetical protein AB4Y37_00515 [Paraburkholderia caribensis]|nr:hypothetical protein [Paraburkholderia caribensis]